MASLSRLCCINKWQQSYNFLWAEIRSRLLHIRFPDWVKSISESRLWCQSCSFRGTHYCCWCYKGEQRVISKLLRLDRRSQTLYWWSNNAPQGRVQSLILIWITVWVSLIGTENLWIIIIQQKGGSLPYNKGKSSGKHILSNKKKKRKMSRYFNRKSVIYHFPHAPRYFLLQFRFYLLLGTRLIWECTGTSKKAAQ